MRQNSVCFLKTGGIYVDASLCECLRRAAFDMVQLKTSRLDFEILDSAKIPIGAGSMSTAGRTVTLGAFGGVKFEVDLSMGRQQGTLSFILDVHHLNELPDGIWLSVPMSALPPEKPSELN